MRPSWAQRLPWDVITSQAERHAMEPCLIAAVIMKESSGVQWRTRFEPGYRWFLAPESFAKRLGVSVETERQHQATSWSLMQVMGATAREVGFLGYFPELAANPSLGIYYGAKFLKLQLERYKSVPAALAAYNAGGPRCSEQCKLQDDQFDNQGYVDRVLEFYRELAG